MVDFAFKATYNVVPFTELSPVEGGFSIQKEPVHSASPFGWHSDGKKNYTDTQGNNVRAITYEIDTQGEYTTKSEKGLKFEYSWDGMLDPTNATNPNASTTNLFYCNFLSMAFANAQ